MRMEVDPAERVSEIVDSAAEYWRKDPGAYVLKKGKALLRPSDTAAVANLSEGDTLELIPDPEGGAAWPSRGAY